MTAAAEPRLLEAFLELGDVSSLKLSTKKALRLCNKQTKSFIDATNVALKVELDDLDALLECDWKITVLKIEEQEDESPPRQKSCNLCCLRLPASSARWKSLVLKTAPASQLYRITLPSCHSLRYFK